MDTSRIRSGAALALAAMVVAAAAAGGCGPSGDDAGPRASAEVVPDDPTAGRAPTTRGAVPGNGAVDAAGLALPRKVSYTGLEITVEKVTPLTDSDLGPGVGLDLTVRNSRAEAAGLSPSLVALVDAGSTRHAAYGFDDPRSPGTWSSADVEVAAGGRVQRTAFVAVEGGLKLATARLSVGAEKSIPAQVPLAGPEPGAAYPLDIAVPTAPVKFTDSSPFTLTLVSAQLAEEYQDTRAEKGTHLVVLRMRVVGDPCDCGGVIVGTGTVRLVVDGTPKEPKLQDPSGCCLLSVGDGHDLTEVYELPDTHTSVSMVGQSALNRTERQQHPFAVTVPPLPSPATAR
jgi:hypothetical protein